MDIYWHSLNVTTAFKFPAEHCCLFIAGLQCGLLC